LNAAIDQQCEKHIRATGQVAAVEAKIDACTPSAACPGRATRARSPRHTTGSALLLLGVSGDEVLPRDTYDKIRAATLSQVRGTVQADILRRTRAQNTCIFRPSSPSA